LATEGDALVVSNGSSRLVLIDTHAHLDSSDFNHDQVEVINRATAQGIGVVTVGVDLESSQAALKLAEQNSSIWAGVGIHPHEASTFNSMVEHKLGKLASKHKAVAIGEIGLDYYRDLSPRQTQREAFISQITLANRLNLPVIIHNRESTADMLAILSKHRPSRGVIHSFLGDVDLARQFLDMGLFLGIGGPLTFVKNDALRQALDRISLERIIIETDCPYLTPVPYRGKRNEPSYVRYVAEQIARLKGIPFQEVAKITTCNARRLFGI
jgi:TatD DNase family protein